jgi:hypothetical protein
MLSSIGYGFGYGSPERIAEGIHVHDDVREARAEKVRENRLRRMAKRQGLDLVKFRVRDPRALDYGRWLVVDPFTNSIVAGEPGYMGLDDVEAFLTETTAEQRRAEKAAA